MGPRIQRWGTFAAEATHKVRNVSWWEYISKLHYLQNTTAAAWSLRGARVAGERVTVNHMRSVLQWVSCHAWISSYNIIYFWLYYWPGSPMWQPQLQVKTHELWYNYMNQSKSLFNISILTADICMHFTTLSMLTKPWNYLKKQIPAVGTPTWTAYIKVTNIRGRPFPCL